MRGLQLAVDVLDDQADAAGDLFSRKKTFVLQMRLGVAEGEEDPARRLDPSDTRPLPAGAADTAFPDGAKAPREDCVITMRCLHGPPGDDKHRVRRAMVGVDGRAVDERHAIAELTVGKVLGDWWQSDGRWGRQASERAKRGRTKERRAAQMGALRGVLPMADAVVVRESVVDSAMLLRAHLSGRIITGAGGMTTTQHAELERVHKRSIRVVTGTPRYAATAAVHAEIGAVGLEMSAAIDLMRVYGRFREYDRQHPARRAVLGVVRRELVSATRGTHNEVGRRFLLAAAVVFGAAAARGRLLDGSASAAQWKRGLDEASR